MGIATTAAQIEIEVGGAIIRAGVEIGEDRVGQVVRAVKWTMIPAGVEVLRQPSG